jgi:hypothetical protein
VGEVVAVDDVSEPLGVVRETGAAGAVEPFPAGSSRLAAHLWTGR